jgi:hypothetical protein
MLQDRPVEEGLVPVLQRHHEDVPMEVGGLGPEVPHDPLELLLDGEGPGGQQAPKTEHVALGGREGGALVESRILEQVEAALGWK